MPHAPGDNVERPMRFCAYADCMKLIEPGLSGYCSAEHRHLARLLADPEFDTEPTAAEIADLNADDIAANEV